MLSTPVSLDTMGKKVSMPAVIALNSEPERTMRYAVGCTLALRSMSKIDRETTRPAPVARDNDVDEKTSEERSLIPVRKAFETDT